MWMLVGMEMRHNRVLICVLADVSDKRKEAAVTSDEWCIARKSCVRVCRAGQTPERSAISSQGAVWELVGHVPVLM